MTLQVVEEKVAKLPKWAQTHISSLNRQLRDMDAKYGRLKSEQESGCTGMVRRGYAISGDSVLLPDYEVYQFSIGGQKFTVNLSGDESCLNIASTDGRLDIEPRASNRIYIRNTR